MIEQARARFRARFGAEPDAAASAPGRVNLIGEHTDYNDGYVLPIAIDRRALVLLRAVPGRVSTLWAADLPEGPGNPARLDLLEPLPARMSGFERYLAGAARVVCEALVKVGGNLDVMLTSTVPIGAGLSSSAAIEVAMATALEALLAGAALDPLGKARLCQRAEHEYGGTPCGIMDMLVACAARAGQALFIDCRSGACRHVPMPPPEQAALLVVDTGVARALADGAYAERRETCRRAAARLGVPALRDATAPMVRAGGLAEDEGRCAAHVVAENERTLAAAAALEARDLPALGQLMHESHASLRDLYQVSCPELDAVVHAAEALRGRGAWGARMTGGGFGGCAIVLCAAAARAAARRHLEERFAASFGRPPRVFEVSAAGGACAEGS